MDKEVLMNFITVSNVLACAFSVIAALALVYELLAIVNLLLKQKKQYQIEQRNDIELLTKLKNSELPDEKAGIFVSLLRSGYALSHKIVNAGGKYDDKRQQTRFKNFLTPTAVEKLNSMDGIAL